MSENDLINENKKRLAYLFSDYDPLSGKGSPLERFPLKIRIGKDESTFYLPVAMLQEDLVQLLQKDPDISSVTKKLFKSDSPVFVERMFQQFITTRFKYDFEFWAFLTCKIFDKESKQYIRFKMRLAQRMFFKELEDMRLSGIPIRIILLKARQWGGSTLVQLYMLWIQTILKENWHSAICTTVENQARNIRGMYSRAARFYPKDVGTITLVPYEGSAKNKLVRERGCTISIGSMENPESLRSYDISMIHLSECGSWTKTEGKSPEDLVQTLRSALLAKPMTLEVMESTAKGVGNFFHREWQDAVSKKSGYRAVFIPWYIIDLYVLPVDNYSEFIKSLEGPENAYYKFLWECGATLEGINWYRRFKTDNRYSDWRMASEFPTTAEEAFQSTGSRVFAPNYVKNMRHYCCAPEFIGQLFAKGSKGKEAFQNIEFHNVPDGNLWIWMMPDTSINIKNRYVIGVDIGGRTEGADYSTVRVLDRYGLIDGGAPEMVATWKGHEDQDLFAWTACQIAKFYNNALFVVESNSLREKNASTEGSHSFTILDEIAQYYDNIYTRATPEKVKGNMPVLYGFHTNHQSKGMIIDDLNGNLRDTGYIEHDARALDEMDCYEYKPDGTMGSKEGTKDDLVMATAIAVWCSGSPTTMDLPQEILPSKPVKKKIISEATI